MRAQTRRMRRIGGSPSPRSSMLELMRFLLLLTVGSLVHAQSPTNTHDVKAIRDLVRTYVDAREARDTNRLAAILAPDADQLVSSGEWRRGRDQLVKGMLASSQQNSGTRTIEVETVRFIAPGVAIADGRYDIAGAGAGPARRMWTSFVLSRHNGTWRIEAIRNMLPSRGQ